MPITYVGGVSSSRNGNSNATTTQSLTGLSGGVASQPAEGDVVVVVCVGGSQGRNPDQSISGYTTIGTQLNPNTQTYDTSLQVSYKRMTSTPDTSITIPAQGNIADGQAWAVMVFRGVHATTPLDVSAVSASGTGTGRFDAAQITPTTGGSWIIIAGGGSAATGSAYTAPADFSTNWQAPSAGADTNDAMAAMGYYTGWSSGAYNPAAVTGGTTNSVDSWASWTIALRPEFPTAAPTIGSSAFTGYAPSLAVGVLALVGSLGITGYQPTATTAAGSVNYTVTPSVGSATLTGYSPTTRIQPTYNAWFARTTDGAESWAVRDEFGAVKPSVGSLVLTGYQPTATTAGGAATVTPSAGALAFTG